MGKFKTFLLNEKHQHELYHATSIKSALQMLHTNSLNMTFATDLEHQHAARGQRYYLSTSRAKFSNYADQYKGSGSKRGVSYNVMVNINAQALRGAGAQVKSVEYWGPEFRKVDGFREEQEERIFTNKPRLEPLEKFVNSIHIYIDPEETNKYTISQALEISRIENKSVPVYFYTDKNAYMGQRTEKAVKNPSGVLREPEFDDDELKFKDMPRKAFDEKLWALVDIYMGKYDESNKDHETVMKWLKYYHHDAHTQIAADIHNARSKHLAVLNVIAKIMRKEKTNSIREFVNLMIDKVKDGQI